MEIHLQRVHFPLPYMSLSHYLQGFIRFYLSQVGKLAGFLTHYNGIFHCKRLDDRIVRFFADRNPEGFRSSSARFYGHAFECLDTKTTSMSRWKGLGSDQW